MGATEDIVRRKIPTGKHEANENGGKWRIPMRQMLCRLSGMRFFLLGFVTALVVLAAAGFCYIGFGMAPVATAAGPLPFERLITGIALHAAVRRGAPTSAPIQPSDEVYFKAAEIYENNCAVCHGLPNQPQTAIAKGEFPKPPALFGGEDVADDPVGVTYWKVANGIRLTGMPGFKGSLTDEQIWEVSLLLANGDKLSPKVLAALEGSIFGQPSPAGQAAAPH
jgi:thiosulfate dehydrogenase